MLVLSRHIGQSLKIGDNIEIQILGIQRGQVRIGIEAPREINVVREELLHRNDDAEVPIEPQRSRHYLQRNRQR